MRNKVCHLKQEVRRVLLILPLLLIAACKTTYVHPGTGMAFPPSVGPFDRVEVHNFDQKGEDVGVGYNRYYLKAVPIEVITVFVYPMTDASRTSAALTRAMNAELDKRISEILHAHPDAKVVGRGPDELLRSGTRHQGLKAEFVYHASMGSKVQLLNSAMHLYRLGNYFIAYRISYPADLKESYLPEMARFVEELEWPKPPKESNVISPG